MALEVSKNLRWILIGALLLIGLLLYFIRQKEDLSQQYYTASVSRGSVEDVVTAYGVLQPFQYVDIGAQVSGILKKLNVDIGSEVDEGEILAEIDDAVFLAKIDAGRASIDNLKAQLKSKEAELAFAKQQHERSQKLVLEHAESEEIAQTHESDYKRAEADLTALQAQIRQAEAQLRTDETNLAYTKIRAPMKGSVITLTARQGQTLNSSQTAPTILRLANLDEMTVWAQVSEADIPKIKPCVKAYFNTLGDLEKRRFGKVRTIYPTPDTINGAMFYNVLFDISNNDHSLLPQMTAQVFFVLNEAHQVLLVPVVALNAIPKDPSEKKKRSKNLKTEKNYTVLVIKDGEVEERQVTVGVVGRILAEVVKGLEENDLIIVGEKSTNERASSNQGRSPLQTNIRRR